LEKQDLTGNVSYDPKNHEHMVRLRAEKVDRIADDIPPAEIEGDAKSELLIVGWGSTYGSIRTAVENLSERGIGVAHLHLRYLNPLPKNVGEILYRYKQILVPELNLGQLSVLLRTKYLVPTESLNKIQGLPFKASEIETKVEELLKGKKQ